ncbi:MAG TPA: P-type DNA transfer ATPase VirB11 [Sphingomonas sp.]|nr:P-type DNA transfer ATPase VirB11 [Sphingomonas sp.]
MSAEVYLHSFLSPLDPWLAREDVTDILVNRPGEIWIETRGGAIERIEVAALSEAVLARLARQIAGSAHQGINRAEPLLSASLPDGARVQVIAPPATRGGHALAIRKHAIADLSLARLAADRLFAPAENRHAAEEHALEAALAADDHAAALALAVKLRKTIVVSGGTSSGKTTLVNALIKEIDAPERLILIEDTPELRLVHENALGLIAVRGALGEARVDAEMLLQAALRMRPDRILLGELRGAETFAFLRAVNTGHPGSITTVHADSAAGALDQIVMMALLANANLEWTAVERYTRRVIDLIVHLERRGGERRVTEIMRLSEPR